MDLLSPLMHMPEKNHLRLRTHPFSEGVSEGTRPSIGDDNTTSPKENNLNGSLLVLGFDNTSNALTMMTPMSTSNHISRETQSPSAERQHSQWEPSGSEV